MTLFAKGFLTSLTDAWRDRPGRIVAGGEDGETRLVPISTPPSNRGVPAIKLSRREWPGVGPRLAAALLMRLAAWLAAQSRADLLPQSTLLNTGALLSSLLSKNGSSSPLSRAYCCLTHCHNMPATRLHDSTDDGVS